MANIFYKTFMSLMSSQLFYIVTIIRKYKLHLILFSWADQTYKDWLPYCSRKSHYWSPQAAYIILHANSKHLHQTFTSNHFQAYSFQVGNENYIFTAWGRLITCTILVLGSSFFVYGLPYLYMGRITSPFLLHLSMYYILYMCTPKTFNINTLFFLLLRYCVFFSHCSSFHILSLSRLCCPPFIFFLQEALFCLNFIPIIRSNKLWNN